MLCSEVMHKNVEFVRADDDVCVAAKKMRDVDIGFLPVCDSETNRIVGTLTDRDITIRLVAEGRTPDVPVEEIMSTAPLFCHADDDLAEAHGLMKSHQVSRMIVLDESDHLAGIISLADLASQESFGETLSAIKHP
jgi:CBS domain-containing protein